MERESNHLNPPTSNRGVKNYKTIREKKLKDVVLTEAAEDYLTPLYQGYDSIQECFNRQLKKTTAENLKTAKLYADEDDPKRENFIAFSFGGEKMKLAPYSPRGFCYLLKNDDFEFLIGNTLHEWSISVRYLACGLAEHGIHALRKRVFQILNHECLEAGEDWTRLSRIDVAFDFHSREFTKEMKPAILDGVVCPSKTKVHGMETLDYHMRARKIETLTIGSKNSLQVQVYDKCKEISEASGKTWIYKLWGAEFQKDVWRVELRFFSSFLRDRNVKTLEDFEEHLIHLVGEGLILRRIAINNGDSNPSRWDLHPLWSECYRLAGLPKYGLAIGRFVTTRKDILEKQLIKQIAGTIRSFGALTGICDELTFIKAFKAAKDAYMNDPLHEQKVEKAQIRYMFINEAA